MAFAVAARAHGSLASCSRSCSSLVARLDRVQVKPRSFKDDQPRADKSRRPNALSNSKLPAQMRMHAASRFCHGLLDRMGPYMWIGEFLLVFVSYLFTQHGRAAVANFKTAMWPGIVRVCWSLGIEEVLTFGLILWTVWSKRQAVLSVMAFYFLYPMHMSEKVDVKLSSLTMETNDMFDALQTDVDSLKTCMISLETKMVSLGSKVESFNTEQREKMDALLTAVAHVSTAVASIASDIRKGRP